MKTEIWQAGRITLNEQEIRDMFLNSIHAGEAVVGSDIQISFENDGLVINWAGPVNLVDPSVGVKKTKTPYDLGLSAANIDMRAMEKSQVSSIAVNPFEEGSPEFDEWERGYSASGIDL